MIPLTGRYFAVGRLDPFGGKITFIKDIAKSIAKQSGGTLVKITMEVK